MIILLYINGLKALCVYFDDLIELLAIMDLVTIDGRLERFAGR